MALEFNVTVDVGNFPVINTSYEHYGECQRRMKEWADILARHPNWKITIWQHGRPVESQVARPNTSVNVQHNRRIATEGERK